MSLIFYCAENTQMPKAPKFGELFENNLILLFGNDALNV